MKSNKKVNLKDYYKQFRVLINSPDNFKLISKLKSALKSTHNPDNLNWKSDIEPQEKAEIIMASYWIVINDHLLPIAKDIYLFHSEPYKILEWIKIQLAPFDNSLRRIFKELLIDVITDKRRFNFSNDPQWDFLIQEIRDLKLEECDKYTSLKKKNCLEIF